VRFPHGLVYLILVINVVGAIGSLLSGVYSQILMSISLSINLFIAFVGFNLFKDSRSLNALTIFSVFWFSDRLLRFFMHILVVVL